ncbi:MAG: hypothetical protein RO257_10305 [Candidatus Kapabacteria bacterium]|nr:hypothetical protein [Candidatus Kapabacteria bacterium]
MSKILTIFLFILVLLSGCQDPSALETPKEIVVVYDPNNLPPVFVVEPLEIDFGIVHPDKIHSKNFLVRNITDKNVTLKTITTKNFTENYQFVTQLPFTLTPKGTTGEFQNIVISFTSVKPGKFDDIINWTDFKNPVTNIKAKVASVWAGDIKFGITEVGNLDLKILNLINSSNVKATVKEFEIIDPDGVILNEPAVVTPLVIEPNSRTKDIYLTFNPGEAKDYKAQIRIKIEYAGTDEHYTDETIELDGRGIF